MPIEIRDLDDGLGVLIKGTGYLTGKEYHSAVLEHLAKPHERLEKYLYTISDYTEVEKFDINLSYIREIAYECINISKINKHVILAFATHDVILYGILNFFVGLAKLTRWNMTVFKNRADMDKWLRIKLKEKFGQDDFKFDYE